MDVEGDPVNTLWKTPLLLYTKDAITSPLTTIPESFNNEAVKLFKVSLDVI